MLLSFNRAIPALFLLVPLVGCGGSSSKGSTTVPQTTAQVATAIVKVNVTTGEVTVTPPRTVFAGPSVAIKTSVLTNLAASQGVKTMAVTLTNSSTQPIGIDPNGNVTGVKVLFGGFTITGGSANDLVALSNPTGVVPASPSAPSLPYIAYPGQLGAAKTSDPQNWNFVVPAGVTAFSVPVTIEADNAFLSPTTSANSIGSSSAYVRLFTGAPAFGFQDGFPGEARFTNPEGIAIDREGDIFLADSGSHCIRRISPSGRTTTVAGTANVTGNTDGAGNAALFNQPIGMAVTPDGSTLYVGDRVNNLVRRIAFTGTDPTNSSNWTVSTICGLAGITGGAYSNPTRGDLAPINDPHGIAVDSGGNVFFAETSGNRVRELSFLGGDPASAHNWNVLLIAGDTSAINGVAGTTDAKGKSARFNGPLGVAVDSGGLIYVCEVNNHRVRVLTYDGNVTTLAGGKSGDIANHGYIDGPAIIAQFNSPQAIAVDRSGLIYVADTGNRAIRLITQGANVATIAGTTANGQVDGSGDVATFTDPFALAVSSSGTAYVCDLNEIRLIENISAK